MTLVVLIIVLAYLIGSIPTALWIGRSTHGVDVREHGSKHAGATNTFRILGRKCGWIVLTIEVVLGYKYSPPLGLVNTYTGVAAVIAKSALLLSTMALFPASLTRTLDCVLGVFGTCQA